MNRREAIIAAAGLSVVGLATGNRALASLPKQKKKSLPSDFLNDCVTFVRKTFTEQDISDEQIQKLACWVVQLVDSVFLLQIGTLNITRIQERKNCVLGLCKVFVGFSRGEKVYWDPDEYTSETQPRWCSFDKLTQSGCDDWVKFWSMPLFFCWQVSTAIKNDEGVSSQNFYCCEKIKQAYHYACTNDFWLENRSDAVA